MRFNKRVLHFNIFFFTFYYAIKFCILTSTFNGFGNEKGIWGRKPGGSGLSMKFNFFL